MLAELKGTEPELVAGATEDPKLVEQWLAELGGKKPADRARAAYRLAQLPEVPEGVLAKLADQIVMERSQPARASELMALGAISRACGDVAHWEQVFILTGEDSEALRKPPPLAVRLAAVVALAWICPPLVTAGALALLKEHRDHRADGLPWNDGELGGIIALVLTELEALDVAAALDAIASLRARSPQAAELGCKLLVERVLEPLGPREEEPLIEELRDEQRSALRFTVEQGFRPTSERYGLDFGMPYDDLSQPSWRRYLGLDPAGPMDRLLELEHDGERRSWPVWKWFRMLTRGSVAADDLGRAIGKALSADEIVDLARDALSFHYAVQNEDGLAPSPRSSLLHGLIDALGDEARGPDIDGIRYVLEALHELRAWDLKAAGWTRGPFTPPEA
ncbi:MAG: hypothetical protein JXR96_12670 [Deltaproteobacteria bacterium]|nr:hypothetical protein [Deltaproteobacteria bacterium]